jgi:hypothetical protein
LTLPGLDLRSDSSVQPVASRYTDYAIPAPSNNISSNISFTVNRANVHYYIQVPVQRLQGPKYKAEHSPPPFRVVPNAWSYVGHDSVLRFS